ncbi:CBS domain-containing protein [Antrihabitans stalactiti]|uniref:CBS domain-containing protein n=1 Tax=Antrihabitans stalactiti TaxID=2584121 RepID=A0A848K5V8_9NOCA|nr:CBS domain-containing protein [Antrihabitans stalactiti]
MTDNRDDEIRSVPTVPTVAEVMTSRVVAVGPLATLHEALAAMLGAGVRHLPVVHDGRCVGLLYECDALWELYLRAESAGRAGVCARSPAPFIAPDASLDAAAQVLELAGADALIVGQGDRIAGILTTTDVVHAIARAGATPSK